MPNPRFLKTAKRWRNKDLPSEKSKRTQSVNGSFPDNIQESFIFSYDGPHKDFFQELIAKNNKTFSGTKAEILFGNAGEVENMNIIKRLALVTTIYNNPQLKSANLWPITPMQSEYLLKEGKLTNPEDNWEDLGLVLYDRSEYGENSQESKTLYDSLNQYRQDLGLSESDLENRLIIINAGAEVDSNIPNRVKPIILPGLTQVYQHEVLEKVGESQKFDGYGLNGGLPLINQLGSGSRTLHTPDETEDIGLRVLYRDKDCGLDAGDRDLASSVGGGRVNFALQGSVGKIGVNKK